jgi:hypothetical protein
VKGAAGVFLAGLVTTSSIEKTEVFNFSRRSRASSFVLRRLLYSALIS